MAETKQLLYTLKIEGTQTELDRLVQIRTNIDNLGKDIKELGDTDKKAAEQKKLQLQQERKDYNELQKSIQNRNKAEQASVQTLESMRAKLANLNKELERIPVGTKAFEEQQKKAKALRDEINAVDQASGKWQGNVGNYKNAIIDAFQQMGINVKAITGNVEKFGSVIQTAGNAASVSSAKVGLMSTALKYLRIALISTGIGAIVALLGTLIAYFTTTQKGIDTINKALKPLTTSLQRMLGIVQDVGGALAKILSGDFKQGFKDLGVAVSGVGDKLEQAWKDGERLYQISLQIRQVSLTIAASEGRFNRVIAEQLGILQDVNKSNEERRKAGELAILAADNLNLLKQQELDLQIEQLKIQQAQNDTDAEGIKQLAELGAQKDQAEADAANKKREIQNIINGLQKKAADDALKAIKDQDEAERKRVEQSETYLKESIARALEIKEELKEQAGDVIFKLVDEEEIDDIPAILQSLQDLSAQEVQLAKDTTEQIKGTYTQRLEALQGALRAGIISEQQYAARKMQINAMVLDDSIAALKGVAKEGSAIGRALFIFEKALSVKRAFMAIIEGTGNTAKVGFPQNIPLLIGFAAQVAGLIGAIQGVAAPEPPKFARGVIGLQGAGTETSDSIDAKLSRGESVMTAKATRAFAPVLADMERAVGNTPNFQAGGRRFAGGYIPQPTPAATVDISKAIREAVGNVAAIPVVVAESDITSTQSRVRKIKVAGDL